MSHIPRGAPERQRFGRVGRIPTPTPFPVGDIHAYLIFPLAGSESLTLVDTGVRSPEAFEAMRRGFKDFGFALEQVDRILVTHAHPDHYGQARRLRDLSGAQVFASAIEAERMRVGWSPRTHYRERASAWLRHWGVPQDLLEEQGAARAAVPAWQEPVEVDVVLGEDDRLALGDFTLEVIETPGHCEGHIVFYEAETRTLFSGDHLLTDISPVPLLHIPDEGEERQKSLIRFMHSLDRVERLACDQVFPSHGDVIWDHRTVIAGYRLHHERRKLQIARYLESGPLTPFEIGARMFRRHYRTELFLVMSEVIGHLDLLVEEGMVVLEERGGVARARHVGRHVGQ
jgi:glyoxylase-like metal-dependent hydrolase (beta-lactamase superfamily II)